MDGKRINVDKEDQWVWKESHSTEFTIKSAYTILKDEA